MARDVRDRDRLLRKGKRVRVGIPLSDGSTFQEWGSVSSLDGDLLTVGLSRDSLPQQARIHSGITLRIGVIDEKTHLGCNASISDWDNRHSLVLRLLDDLVPYEPREFFRQDLCLPLEYRLPPSQFPQEIKEHWRQCRWAVEFAAQEPEPDEGEELRALREEIHSRLEKRKAAPPVAANVSGGGMRLDLCERLRPGMLVELGIYLPQPQKVLEVVGEVVQVTASAEKERFNTALRYRFIDEADRDRLIGYIAAQQLWQLSQQAPKSEQVSSPTGTRVSAFRVAVALLILAAFIGCQVRSILVSRERGEKHEIARVFEHGIMDFLKQRR